MVEYACWEEIYEIYSISDGPSYVKPKVLIQDYCDNFSIDMISFLLHFRLSTKFY